MIIDIVSPVANRSGGSRGPHQVAVLHVVAAELGRAVGAAGRAAGRAGALAARRHCGAAGAVRRAARAAPLALAAGERRCGALCCNLHVGRRCSADRAALFTLAAGEHRCGAAWGWLISADRVVE